MISREKELKLISIYLFLCDLYEMNLSHTCQRFSNHANPEFTDQEIITISLFAGFEQQYFTVKQIHAFAKDYLGDWFPKLPGYKVFSARLNLLSAAFQTLAVYLITVFKPQNCSKTISLVDSMPIFTSASKNRVGKVAPEITAKGYCASKDKYYYGCKLHELSAYRNGTIPFPESLVISSAEDNDLTVFRQSWGDILYYKTVFGDKIYSDFDYLSLQRKATQQIEMLTPVKAVKGQCEELKQRDRAFNDLFSCSLRLFQKLGNPLNLSLTGCNKKPLFKER